jgi:CBS domain-containing protein
VTTVGEIMSTELVTIAPSATVAEAATIMGGRRVGSALVRDGESLAGIFTERDILKALSQDFDAPGQSVMHWMTRDPTTVEAQTSVQAALDLMLQGGFRHLPVLEGGHLVGMVSIRDLSRAAASRAE